MVVKDRGGRVSILLVYPNLYGLGMSNLGFQSVYRLFNEIPDCLAERAFLPAPEDLVEYEKSGTRLFSLETQSEAHTFDAIAFSVSFEDDYLNILRILRLCKIPLLAAERDESHPLLIAGGAAPALNPEPVADFLDICALGDGEGGLIDDLVGIVKDSKEGGREAALEAAALKTGIYVLSLYNIEYDADVISAALPLKGAPARVKAAKCADLTAHSIPESVITTPEAGFSGATLLEVERGCGRGCRFCAAGFLYLPTRLQKEEDIKDVMTRAAAGEERVGLIGAAVSEYPALKEILRDATEKGLGATLSSLRVDCLDDELVGLLKGAGLRTVTVAPEAATERLRDVINKCTSDEEIFDGIRTIKDAGFTQLRLYFMVGLPTETDADAKAIVEMTRAVKLIFGKGPVTVSINPFVPKPCTPFQWHPFEQSDSLKRRYAIIKKGINSIKGVTLKALSIRKALEQAIISRGDRRLGPILAAASAPGATFASAVRPVKAALQASARRQRERAEILPWDIIDHGFKRDYLYEEYQRGLKGVTMPPCNLESCTRCGIC